MTRTDESIRNHYAGDSLVLKVTARESDGDLVDLTDCTIEYGLAKTPMDDPIFTKDTTDGIFIMETDGKFQIHLDPPDTEGLSGTYYHEVELTDADGDVSTLLTGDVEILPSIV